MTSLKVDQVEKGAKFLLWYKDPSTFFRDIYNLEPYPYQIKVLRKLKENPRRVILMAAGGCLIEGSKILLSNGTYENIENIKEGDLLLSYNNNLLFPNRAVELLKTGYKKVYRLRNKLGGELIATEDHPILTYHGYKKLSSFSRNRINNHKALFVKSYDVPDLNITDDEIIFLSCLIAEGHYGNGQSPKITNNDIYLLKRLSEMAEKFDVNPKLYKKENGYDLVLSRNIRFGRSKLINYLRDLGIYGQTKENKRLPKILFKMSNRQIQIFLHYFVECDGSISITSRTDKLRFSIYTGLSKKLAEDIMLLCNRIGVFPKLIERMKENSTAPMYELRFYEYSDIFIRKIGTEITHERFWIEEEIGEKLVYDIAMEGTHNYIAQNLIVHNTGKTKLLACIALWLAVVLPKFIGRPYTVIIISGSQDQAKYLYEYSKFAIQDTSILQEEVEGEPMISVTYFKDRSLIMAVPNSLKAIQGKHMDCVIVDEGALAGDFIIQDTLRIVSTSDRDLILLSGTPMIYSTMFVEIWEEKEKYPNWDRFNWSAKDCPGITSEKWNEAKGLPDDMFSIFWEGKPYAKLGTLISIDDLKASSKDVPLQQYDPRFEVVGGLDWGWQHYTALVLAQYNKDSDKIHIIYKDAWHREEFEDMHDKIAQICSDYKVARVYTDSEDVGENQRLSSQKGLNIIPIHFSEFKIQMQSHLKVLFHQNRIVLPEAYHDIVTQLRKYNWDTKKEDDFVDALQLAVWGLKEEKDEFYFEIL